MCTVNSPLDWLWKITPKWYPTLWNPSIGSEVMEMSFSMSATVTSLLDWPWKTNPKRLLNCQNPSTGWEVKELSFLMSADVYSNLTIRLALKKYPKMIFKLPKSIHWFKRYSEINSYIGWCVQWPYLLDWPRRTLPKWLINWAIYVILGLFFKSKSLPLDQKLWR